MSSFTDSDKGWKEFMAKAKINAGETEGFAGYLRSSGDYKNQETRKAEAKKTGKPVAPAKPITMAQLASVHEFGSKDKTIPERSFMRSALAEHSRDMKRLTKKVTLAVVLGKLDKRKGVGIICQHVIDWFADKIDSNVPPPNEPETVKRKGSDHTLIDTGQLKNSLDWEIKKAK